MCWQSISLKDPTRFILVIFIYWFSDLQFGSELLLWCLFLCCASQELLEAVERERNIRLTPPRSAIFHHPTLGDFELQHVCCPWVPVERIILLSFCYHQGTNCRQILLIFGEKYWILEGGGKGKKQDGSHSGGDLLISHIFLDFLVI